jgi:hypothetical protein
MEMTSTTMPASRFGWQGQTVEYVVKAQGASQIAVPAKGVDGLKIRILGTRQVGDSIEAKVAVDVAGPVLY